MGGDGEALRHRGLKNLSLRLEMAKLWWWVPALGHVIHEQPLVLPQVIHR